MYVQLWALYVKYVDDVEHGAQVARRAFGFKTRELLRVHRLTREEFEVCIVDDSGDPDLRRSWLTKMLAFAEGDEERRTLGQALGALETQCLSL